MMDHLYNYGISQEDVRTEIKALDLSDGDSLLCIASAGEVPLNIASLFDVKIKAADVSANQLRLCRIKQVAALNPDTVRSASFLGYMNMEKNERGLIFRNEIAPYLSGEDRRFWESNSEALKNGVINAGRFERFMQKAAYIGRFIVGSKNLYELFECDSIEEQADIFDRKIKGLFLKGLFKVTFHPKIYKNRGIDPAGLTHSGATDIADFFFNRFRNFCCNTPSRRNYFFQYTFFNKVLFPEAMPEFLQPSCHDRFLKNYDNIEYAGESVEKILSDEDCGKFNKLHISNIGDWQSEEKMQELLRLINIKTVPGARVSMRYIHFNHRIPSDLPSVQADYNLGRILEQSDRYPFYSIVPLIRN
jgi:S-adenosylmethionine-diacylglycerol 3-amino-3-carboxypropyl transferase